MNAMQTRTLESAKDAWTPYRPIRLLLRQQGWKPLDQRQAADEPRAELESGTFTDDARS